MEDFGELELMAKALEDSKQYRVLRTLPRPYDELVPQAALINWPQHFKRGVIVDTETTGLDTSTCEIIEIFLREFVYDEDFRIVGWTAAYHGLQEPTGPLSDEIRRITGLTDDDLAMEQIDKQCVERCLGSADLIIAHNAAYDRPIIERYFATASKAMWACSMAELPWKTWGFPSQSLSAIATHLGYFFNPHRAQGDVDALASILTLVGGGDNGTFMQYLGASAMRQSYRVFAIGSPFSSKDKTKARGYHWDSAKKLWYMDIMDNRAGALDKEMEWLVIEGGCSKPIFKEMSARERYK